MSTDAEGVPADDAGPECDSSEQQACEQGTCWCRDWVREHSCAATLIALGGGLLAGYLVGQSTACRRGAGESRAVERLGRRLADHLDRVLPEAVAKRFRG